MNSKRGGSLDGGVKKPILYGMCGLPFAGKSTLALAIANALHLPIVSLDWINGERGIGLNGAAISASQWQETYRLFYLRAEQWLEKGISVVCDAANYRRKQRNQLRSIAARTNAETVIIHVVITVQEAEQRLLANRRQPTRSDIRDDNFWLVVNSFEAPTGGENVVIFDCTISVERWIAEQLPRPKMP